MEPLRCGHLIFVICCVFQWQHSRGRPLYDQFSSLSYSYSEGCGDSEFWNTLKNQCEECPPCPPGSHSECGYGEGEGAPCVPCPPAYYNDGSDTVCSPCNYCHNRETLQKCTDTTNTKCGDCLPGCTSFQGLCVLCSDIPVPIESTRPPPTSPQTTSPPPTSPLTTSPPPTSPQPTSTDSLDRINPLVLFVAVILLVSVLLSVVIIGKVWNVVSWGTPNTNSDSSMSSAKYSTVSTYSTVDQPSDPSTPESQRKSDIGTVQISLIPGKGQVPSNLVASPVADRRLEVPVQVHHGSQGCTDTHRTPQKYKLSPATKRKEALQKYASVLSEISDVLDKEKLTKVVTYVEHAVQNFHTSTAEKVTSFDHLAKTLAELEECSDVRPCVLVRGLHAAKRIDLSRKLYKVSQCNVHKYQECFEDDI